ncbi:MAG: glycoside hydrolase family 3 protein [Chlorobiaceae bacterium]|nr:glycoside hydrolase family 3 protein [Chlorobiaceae bacterium]
MKKRSSHSHVCLFILLLFMAATSTVSARSKPGTEKWCAQQIFNRQDSRIEESLKSMTLSEKVGEMLIGQIEGHYNSSNDKEYQLLSRLVQEGKVGGIMFLKGDAFSAGMLANHFQSIAPRPLLMSADMERGVAMRLSGATEFPPNMAVAATQNAELAADMAKAIAEEAKIIGLHQNYAPTVDLNINPQNPIINTRSFGDSLPLTISMSNAIIKGLQSHGIIATAKHFPGHGDVTIDSHLSLPVLQADRQRLEAYELKPFKAAIEQGVISIMTGHLAVPKLTGTMEPASISKTIVTDLLRNELGFRGLIITDALNMKALYNGQNVPEISVKAVMAGNDLLLFSPDPELAHSSIVKAVEEGVIPLQQIDASVRRILQVKTWLDIEHRKLVDLNRIKEEVNPESHRTLAKKIASRSLTLVNDANHYLPLKTEPSSGRILNIMLQDKADGETGKGYIKNLDQYFTASHIRIDPDTSNPDYVNAAGQAMNASAVIVTAYVKALSGSGTLKLTEKQQQFIHSLTGIVPKERPLIFVSLGTPYIINYFPEITTYLCTYSSNESSEEYAVDVLRGKLKPEGILPVSLQGTPR